MTPSTERTEDFTVVDNHLVRSVIPARGEPYEHRCPRASYEEIRTQINADHTEGDIDHVLDLLAAYPG